jgi:hypothetical protein
MEHLKHFKNGPVLYLGLEPNPSRETVLLKGFVSHDIAQLKLCLAGVRSGVSYLTLPAFLLKSLPSVQREKRVRDHHSVLTEKKYWSLFDFTWFFDT